MRTIPAIMLACVALPAVAETITLDAAIVSHDAVAERRLTWFLDYLNAIDSPNARESLTVLLEASRSAEQPPAIEPIAAFASSIEAAPAPRAFSWSGAAAVIPSPGVATLAALAFLWPGRRR